MSDRLERKIQNDGGVGYQWLYALESCVHGAILNFGDLTPFIYPVFLNVLIINMGPVLTKKKPNAYSLATKFCSMHCTRALNV
jgi:hypothetical protein